MDIKELNSFKLSDAIKFHNKLNPNLWTANHLEPEVRKQLLAIAEDFMMELGISDVHVEDIRVSGSNAAYSYTKHSDLDLHIVVDMSKLPSSDVYQELFTAKKTLYNDSHDITVHDVPVEVYVQDANKPVVSLGEYSVLNNQWIKHPVKRRANFDQNATKAKYDKLADLVDITLNLKDVDRLDDVLKLIKRYRQSGLSKGGEFSPENLAYKAIRTQGGIDKLYDLRDKLHSERLSIEEAGTREDAIRRIKSLQNTTGRTQNEIANIKRITDKLIQQYNIKPEEIGLRVPVDPLKGKLAKAAYEKQMAASALKNEWERFKRGIFAEDEELDEDSRFSGTDGESEVVHHVTPHRFSEFNPLSHFGTKKAAGARAFALATDYHYGKPHADAKYNAIAARLKLGNVVDIADTGTHTAKDIAHSLCRKRIISPDERDEVLDAGFDRESDAVLLAILKDHNINTLRYENEIEHPGSISYIITDPAQVRILKRSNNANIKFEKYRKYNSDADWNQGPSLEELNEEYSSLKSWRNPSPTALYNLTKKAKEKRMRGMYYNGDTYWWDAYNAIHSIGAKSLGIPYDYRNRLETAIDKISDNYYVGWDDNVPDNIMRRYEIEEEQLTEAYTTKQQVIDHFVRSARARGEDVNLAARKGAGAWERGWRGPKSKAKKAPEIKPYDPDRYKNVRLPYIDEASEYIPNERELDFFVGDCPVFAIALHKLSGLPLMGIVDYDEDIDDWALVHAYVKQGENAIDASGLTTVEDILAEYPNSGEAEEVEFTIPDLIKIGYGNQHNCPSLTEVIPIAKQLLTNLKLLNEASGYIPSAKEKNDPRFKTALTVTKR